ncbi:hypothetical protein GOBAR_AA29130 [Gossypium barbadense]|uniref:Uncharacterized protein n=1 Tax=Gossypium barbadense TaxID=3634 RepID=A0A2P5WKF2_GOSBA|nr:hypothetical protein GOBAR_AA29130 [Gossypium barbadense]
MVQPSLQEMSLKEAHESFSNPHIVATTSNEEIPLTVLKIFPFGTVEVIHPKFGTFKVNSHFVWETKQSPFKLAIPAAHWKLKEMSLKEAHESFSSNRREPIHEDQKLQIEYLDEWWTHKSRTLDKPNLR